MQNYAIVESEIVQNVVLASPEYAASRGWVALPKGAGIGWTFNGSAWSPPAAPAVSAEAVRADRTQRLTATDWVVLRAVENGSPVPGNWIAYRQALRDITKQPGFPGSVSWPVAPAA
jgi:hypothetical protein